MINYNRISKGLLYLGSFRWLVFVAIECGRTENNELDQVCKQMAVK
jgi:hypothetical protein